MAISSKSISLSIFTQLCFISYVLSQQETKFLHHGFFKANLLKFGSSKINPSGFLELTNNSKTQMGQTFHGFPIPFINKNSSKSFTFSTSFVFSINPDANSTPGHGLTFLISPSMDFNLASPSQFLGLFNVSNNGNSTNRILAVEFDTAKSPEFLDINDNHVGIDVNGLVSVESTPASYFDSQKNKSISLKLSSGDPIRVWIEYRREEMLFNVTLAPLENSKPKLPLLSRKMNLSEILMKEMYVGFSAATGNNITSSHYVIGWSFSLEGKAEEFNITQLPSLQAQAPTEFDDVDDYDVNQNIPSYSETMKPIICTFYVAIVVKILMIFLLDYVLGII